MELYDGQAYRAVDCGHAIVISFSDCNVYLRLLGVGVDVSLHTDDILLYK